MQPRKHDISPMTTTLKIEHAIVNFETWKRAFERDPVGREQAGVRRYRVYRPLDDPRYVIIDLDFDSPADAEAFLKEMRRVWSRADLSPGLARPSGASCDNVGPTTGPQTRIVQEVDERAY
jgi:hypothetical protein